MYYDDDLDGLISYRLYDSLKWLGLIVLPGLGVFLGTIGPYFIGGNYNQLHSLLVVDIVALSNGLILSLCQSMAKIDKKEIEEEKKKKEEENSSE